MRRGVTSTKRAGSTGTLKVTPSGVTLEVTSTSTAASTESPTRATVWYGGAVVSTRASSGIAVKGPVTRKTIGSDSRCAKPWPPMSMTPRLMLPSKRRRSAT